MTLGASATLGAKLSLLNKEALTRFVIDLFRNLLAIYIIMLVFSFISPGYVEFYIDLNLFIYLLIVLGAASLLFYVQKLENSYITKFDEAKKRIPHAFLVLVLIEALQSIAPQPELEGVKTPLMVVAVALGAISFYLNQDMLGEIKEEEGQEGIDENKRKREFAGRYPKINRVWGIRWVVRWMYKEGWWYSGMLVLILVLALSLRSYHLGEFYTIDEGKWLFDRVPNFYNSLHSGNLAGTLTNDKPGSTISWISYSGLGFFEEFQVLPQRINYVGTEKYLHFLFWSRFPLVVTCLLYT